MRRRHGGLLRLLAILGALGASGCFVLDRPQVGVKEVGPEQVALELDGNVLSDGMPSSSTIETLHYFGLRERFEDAPEATIAELHAAILADPARRFLHSIAELCYLRAYELGSRELYLAAAVYSYLYLLGEQELEPASPYDRRFRWACDLYNRSLREAFVAAKSRNFVPEGGTRSLPVGMLTVQVDDSRLPLDASEVDFLPADDYSIWGLSFRNRDSGLGTPLVARKTTPPDPTPGSRIRPNGKFAAVTAFLRVQGRLAELQGGVQATLELHSTLLAPELEVSGKSVPLESDLSAALGLSLHRSGIWGASSRGLFGAEQAGLENGLILSQPYHPGLIPVVFVHGTASNPGNWAEMFNLLLADEEIRGRMQIWFFQYSTGAPILYSAGTLRDALREAVQRFDPEGKDEALKRMVLVGHSQGGLLAKLALVDGQASWFEQLTGTSIEESGLEPEQKDLLRWAFDFDPVPNVERVVFVSTPHRGSFHSDRWYSRLIAGMVNAPNELAQLGQSSSDHGKELQSVMKGKIPTSIDNMRTDNPLLAILARTPLAPRVVGHSIIPIGPAGDPARPEGADDGVVTYASAHIEGVESEFLLRAGHSCQSSPLAIREVRRILREHLRASL